LNNYYFVILFVIWRKKRTPQNKKSFFNFNSLDFRSITFYVPFKSLQTLRKLVKSHSNLQIRDQMPISLLISSTKNNKKIL